MDVIDRVREIVDGVRAELEIDPRTSVFDVDAVEEEREIVIVGATSEPAAEEMLQRRIGSLDLDLPVRVEIARLPHPDGGLAHALVTASLAPMLSGPFPSDAPISQVVLGQRLLVLRDYGGWLHCRSPDGYLGWVNAGYLRRVDEIEARNWEGGEGGERALSLGGRVVDVAGATLRRLPWGARVTLLRDGRVRLPDGSVGRAIGAIVPETERARRYPRSGREVVATAEMWMGVPYVWGGITRAGTDCSGLAQVVMRTHGVELPRDSDLQERVGQEVMPGREFSGLRPGDLLYFAAGGGRVSHVAISSGGPRLIHAAVTNGGVARNDLTGPLDFERELRSAFLSARRVLPGA